jgi:hypothetical protein
MRRALKVFLAALGIAFCGATARADPINIGQWYTFGFSGAGGDPLISGVGFVIGQRSVAIGDAPWTFDCLSTTHCKLVVTDGFLSVDQFELFDFGVSLGLTSAPTPGDNCGNDELACLADADFSHGVFVLAPGPHSITGIHTLGIPGAGFLIVMPEPGTLLLLGAALLGFATLRRRI